MRFIPSIRPASLALPALLALQALATPALAQLDQFAHLGPPVAPPENPLTAEKALLGKILFWDEQLSATKTVACGTCHQPAAGFADPRVRSGPPLYPGADRTLGTPDDVFGSPSLPRVLGDHLYESHVIFGMGPQATRRSTPSVLNVAYAPHLFLDGRANDTFVDPDTGAVISATGAALENQALGPLLSDKEMSTVGRTAAELAQEMHVMIPLADAEAIPQAMAQFINAQRYPHLFERAFGDEDITGVRIAQALASYMRTLVVTDVPFDRFLAGDSSALTAQERAGHDLFHGAARCSECHGGPLLTDFAFHNIGVDPVGDDTGREQASHDLGDRGKWKTPGLRAVELTAPYFHDGSAATLEDVVEFYDIGGLHTAPNLAPQMVPLGLSSAEKAALVAFLKRPLTDPRLALEQVPFDRPRLFSESSRAPLTFGEGTAGSGGFVPRMSLLEGARRAYEITIAVEHGRGGAPAGLLSATAFYPAGAAFQGSTLYVPYGAGSRLHRTILEGSGPGNGHASLRYDLGSVSGATAGTRLYFQWLIYDPTSQGRLAASEAALAVMF
ncbi:Cytochrome c551 peroxidase precursor [Planctomycetes bacterium Poly30]|uniref:Cytochrome c551 peroxidase n=1 Tax=Saltatorellus ferox TaxID=2528018 RepID=A0A518ENP5_9BACT|nr:Cytochrome c551 peroxidase precursor [Planctomycetes bacterium Poly30]